MKRLRLTPFAAAVLILLFTACAPQLPLNNTAMPASPASPTQARPTQGSVPVTGSTPFASILQSLTDAHPPMQDGSIDRYFDGSLLDAVPDNGPFLMGLPLADGSLRQVSVSSFWIYSTEVSNRMYAWCVNLGKCTPPNAAADPGYTDPALGNNPIVGVSWQQASDYCDFAHGRLPTEAEWEKAASWDDSLKQKRLYPWGDADPSCDLLNYKYCHGKPTSVAGYGQGASYYGAFNMAGNVYEWVGDWFQNNPALDAAQRDPAGPATGTRRVVRSSAYDSDATFSAPTARFAENPTAQHANLGFRCVVKDPAYYAPFCTMPLSYGVDVAANGVSSRPCADPEIIHSEICTSDNRPLDLVTVRADSSTSVSIQGFEQCSPASNEAGVQHQCPPGVTLQVTASCNAVPGGTPACPPNFKPDPKNPNQCISPGGAGSCPAGFQYDTSMQCCSAVPGNAAAVPLCAVGQHPYGSVCVNDFGGPLPPASITFTTGARDCVATPSSSNGPAIVPFPGSTSSAGPTANPPPPPTEPPPPGGDGGKCSLKPKDCQYGVDQVLCVCLSGP